MLKYYVIESADSLGFYAGEAYGKFKGWLWAKKYLTELEAEAYLINAIKFGPCKITIVYDAK